MEDRKIIDLYQSREERAISETDRKYGPYCYKIAYNILENKEDSEESVYDSSFILFIGKGRERNLYLRKCHSCQYCKQ